MQSEIEITQLRRFGLTIGGIFVVIGLWPALFRSEDTRLWALVVASLLVIPALVLPRSLMSIYRVWMVIGHVLGRVNTAIMLGVIYYCMFMPMGLAMRLLGKDPMRRKFEEVTGTYRVLKQTRPNSHMTQQF